MRLTNRNKAPYFSFVNTFLVLFAMAGIVLFFLDAYKMGILGWRKYIALLVPLTLVLAWRARGREIFEYDSDGEALNFKNRNVTPLLRKISSDEFPKYKLQKYTIVNALIFRKLYVTISSKKNHQLTLRYDISFLTPKEVTDLKVSLNKIIKNNNQNVPSEIDE